MILVIDNYDSFVYNLVQYIGEMEKEIIVYRNDKISLEIIEKLKPARIIISPGPGRPEEAGISCELIKKFSDKIPILGVCLGHQCIGYVYGAKIAGAARIMHGKTSSVFHHKKDVFKDIENPFTAARYHSLIVEKKLLPDCLKVTAWTKESEIMGIRHKKYKVYGVQFHPESILTDVGKKILKNFLNIKS
ncbi:aminodeoxychorismate/anthranilate synthase component II [bacterium]|nr:aminodeoxychorismate/anthranilate synthase component II [bacterium]